MDHLHPLPASERAPLSGAQDIGPCRLDERFEVTVLVRSRAPGGFREAARSVLAGGRPFDHKALAQQYGADAADLAAVARFAARHGLAVVEQSAARRSLVISGTAAAFGRAFGVALRLYGHPEGVHRGHAGPVCVPQTLKDVVTAVLGLDNRQQASPHFRRRDADAARPGSRQAGGLSYTPPQVAALYGFPETTGAGQCIGLIELGGGYRPADLESYFAALGIAPTPVVVPVSVDHAGNAPTGDPNGPDGEVELDVELAAAIAPGARITVYFAPNTDRGFVDAVTTAVHDVGNRPGILSISWGGAEPGWSNQAVQALDEALAAAVALGIPVFCAAGDGGSSDGVADGQPHVDFPASSPHVTACGGTRLLTAEGAIEGEVVWNDGPTGGATGGGVSAVFPLPAWQAKAGVPPSPTGSGGRGVPDVAGDADPHTGYRVLVDGIDSVVGGTSAVAPLWAALLARIQQVKGSAAGFLGPALYGFPQDLRDVTQGSNGAYRAGPGWDPCTGLGTPDGARLAELL